MKIPLNGESFLYYDIPIQYGIVSCEALEGMGNCENISNGMIRFMPNVDMESVPIKKSNSLFPYHQY